MIDFYFWPTPNTRKVAIFLEETGLDYRIVKVDIAAGGQFEPSFLAINPNHRVPAIVDRDAPGGPVSLFESGAILLHLAEREGRFLPPDPHGRADVLQWLFWQMAGLGPMAGQLSHFVNYAPEGNGYARRRYADEYARLLSVMQTRLEDRDYLAGTYSIADMAAFPWLLPYRRFGVDLDAYPAVRRWFDAIKARPAVQRAVALGGEWVPRTPTLDERARGVLFGQDGR